MEVSEQRQIVDTLLSNMSAAVWSSPMPEAVETVARQKRQMEASIGVVLSTPLFSQSVITMSH